MKDVVLLGATGSIGESTIDVILSEGHNLLGFSFYSNVEKATYILNKFPTVKYVSCFYEKDAKKLKKLFPNIVFFYGDDSLEKLVKSFEKITLVNAVVGFAGLKPTIIAIERKYTILLANKETIVIGGNLVTDLAKKNNVKIIPIDSEHASIAEAIRNRNDVEKIYITASGGSFRDKSRSELVNVTVEEALKHPNWSMGSKITIDSATMFNKCLEIIEAHYLFDLPIESIETLLHDESLVHAIVRFKNGANSMIITNNDMRIFISYALNYPSELKTEFEKLDFSEIINLHFKPMNKERFPLIGLVYEVSKKNKNYFAVMNASNEAAVKLFLNKKISFLDIEKIIFDSIESYELEEEYSIDELIELSKKIYNDVIRKYW